MHLGASWGCLGRPKATQREVRKPYVSFVFSWLLRPCASCGRPSLNIASLAALVPSWCRLGAVLARSWGVFGASWGVLGASWGRLGHQKPPHGRPKNLIFHRFFKVFVPVRLLRAILAQHSLPDRLGAVFGSSWGVFGSSWGVLGASWRHLGASWRRLGASWARLGKLKNLIVPLFFQCFCVPRLHWHNLASASVLKRLGRVLGTSWERLGRVLGVLGSVLGASWGVLGAAWGHLGASWGRLGGPLGGVWRRLGVS